jgi:hypothetical protein
MFLRIFSFSVALMLVGCSKPAETPVGAAKPEDRVACAIGDSELAADCLIERAGSSVVVRHSDGSFRRFEIDTDGKIGSADGADDVEGKREADGSVDFRIGDAHYRFAPGQLKP